MLGCFGGYLRGRRNYGFDIVFDPRWVNGGSRKHCRLSDMLRGRQSKITDMLPNCKKICRCFLKKGLTNTISCCIISICKA